MSGVCTIWRSDWITSLSRCGAWTATSLVWSFQHSAPKGTDQWAKSQPSISSLFSLVRSWVYTLGSLGFCVFSVWLWVVAKEEEWGGSQWSRGERKINTQHKQCKNSSVFVPSLAGEPAQNSKCLVPWNEMTCCEHVTPPAPPSPTHPPLLMPLIQASL